MSKVAIQGNASGTGTLTIAAPNTNTDRTLTLPDEAGTVDTLQRAGNVLQVVQGTLTGEVTTSTSTYADSGLSATITPSSSSSKILVTVTHASVGKSSADTRAKWKLLRDSTTIFDEELSAYTNSTGSNNVGNTSLTYLDSPATTSAITYKTQIANHNSAGSVLFGWNLTGQLSGAIVLMEIAA